jgi:hypothetical protein
MVDDAGFGGVGRTAVASVAGLFAGIVAAGMVVTLGNAVAPAPPVPVDLGDAAAVRVYLDGVPVVAHLALVLGWATGGFVAGLTGAVAAKGGWRVAGLAAGIGFTLLVVGGLDATPQPTGMWIAALLPLPAAWLGRRLGGHDPVPRAASAAPSAPRPSGRAPSPDPGGAAPRPSTARTLVSEPAATLAGGDDEDDADDAPPSR